MSAYELSGIIVATSCVAFVCGFWFGRQPKPRMTLQVRTELDGAVRVVTVTSNDEGAAMDALRRITKADQSG